MLLLRLEMILRRCSGLIYKPYIYDKIDLLCYMIIMWLSCLYYRADFFFQVGLPDLITQPWWPKGKQKMKAWKGLCHCWIEGERGWVGRGVEALKHSNHLWQQQSHGAAAHSFRGLGSADSLNEHKGRFFSKSCRHWESTRAMQDSGPIKLWDNECFKAPSFMVICFGSNRKLVQLKLRWYYRNSSFLHVGRDGGVIRSLSSTITSSHRRWSSFPSVNFQIAKDS